MQTKLCSIIRKQVLTCFILAFSVVLHAQQKSGWTVHAPFEHNVFIENNGQFIEQVKRGVGDNILYYSHKGHLHVYFTQTGLTFEYDSAYRADDDDLKGKADDDANIKILPVFMHVTWEGANKNANIEVQDQVSDYFTYRNPNDKTGHSGVRANAWKKIIYHNLYNNIDVAFYYPADGKDLEYDLIVHPGGNVSDVKMSYPSDAQLNLINNSVQILSACANFTDRAPIAKDEDGNPVTSSFEVNKNVVSFNVGNYDKSKTLIIDPLYSTTSFTGTNKGYDVQYDLAGNVYVMGGGDAVEYQLQKYNAAGTLLWTYTSTFTYKFKGYYYYSGFTTDNRSGSSYLSEGLDYSGSGCLIVKVNAAGAVVATFPGSTNVNEIWRLAFDYCDNQVIIGAGEGTSAVFQGATMDTSCTTVNAVNVLGAPGGSTHHDIAMITFDGVGKCYFATTKPANPTYTGYENVLLQMPSATLAPTLYQVPDRSLFIETASVPYYPSLPSAPYLYSGNGFNGLIADLNIVATYDGNKLRTWTPASGTIIDSVTVTPNTQLWGGIALDCQDNIYVGNLTKVDVYSSTLGLVSTISLTSSTATDTIYDLHLAPNNNIYACGNDFVSATPVVIPKMVTTTFTNPAGCGCTGTASATVCDNYPYTYSWSNGATTSSVSGLCPGKYLLTVKDASCNPRQDTASVTITGSSGFTVTSASTNVKCNGQTNGTATVTPTGTPPFTYSWSNGNTTTSDTGLAAGTYTCVIKNSGGCIDTEKITITQPAPLTLSLTSFPATCSYLCNGQATVVPAGGTNPYVYSWSNGASGGNVSTLCVGTTYTCVVTDNHGCTRDTTVTISDPPPIVPTITSTPEQCGKLNGSATVSATGGTPGYTYAWNTGGTGTTLDSIASDLYCVIITDANHCTDTACVNVGFLPGDSIKIVTSTDEPCFGGNTATATAAVTAGTAPYTYSWSPSGGTSLTATGLSAGLYTITVIDSNGCKNWAVANITQPTPVAVTVPPDTICIGQTATLTATASGGTPTYTYEWNGTTPGATFTATPASTTTYTVVGTDANGCVSPSTLVTVVVRSPLVVVGGPPATICPGKSVVISAVGAGGDGNYTYTWSPATGLSATTGNTVTANPTVSTVYTVTINDGCSPSAQDTVPLVVYPSPVVGFMADTLQGCYPLCVKFSDQSTVAGGNITGWYWNFGNGDTSTTNPATTCYTKAGSWTVSLMVTTNEGCTGSLTKPNYITTFSHPVASFSYAPTPPISILNPTVYFTDHSTDAYGIVNWNWAFGDETDTNGVIQDPQHNYKDTGIYCVDLIVTNVHGCTDTTQQCLYIEPYYTIYVPNAFTPNGNGLNDIFAAKGVGIIAFQMWIFDRWGQQIYHGNQMYPYGGWDGKVQNGASGEIVQEDTYVWLIECTDVFHKDHRLIGRVTVIK